MRRRQSGRKRDDGVMVEEQQTMSQKETDFLDDMTKPAEAATPAEPETEEAEEVEKGDPEPAKEPEKAPEAEPEKKAEATPAAEPKEVQGLKSGLKAEREKRQQYERELAELKAKLEAQEQQQKPAFFEAPEQFVEQAVSQAEARAHQRYMAALDAQARDTYSDYDDVVAYLTEQAKENPALAKQVMDSPNPAAAAYKLGKKLQDMERMQDPDAFRAQVEAEARAKWEAEIKAKEEAKAKAAAAIPPDLATARNATADTQTKTGTVFDNLFTG